ncbi:hypothetical protein PUR71_23040 [Streptomyces sp. SP17BM10]|uniref:hypothetical protein n=1 Tax=Streptomyces sp. SP17BM10 TaxID=3002530 RepID=UPI002E776F9D|nr:hypothetical protein [Streptomyces sp. SP17BM10]MEE1785757.1 hypothetical protein [Streptomyces sp. SP17BM10]
MTNPPPLLAEDRPEYERLLAEALRDGTVLTALRAPGALTADQLRVRALRDADAIAAAALTEYEHYTRLRESLRSTRPPAEGAEPTAPGLLAQLRSTDGGAGLFPVLTVLTPILAWAAALVLLLLGYALRAADPGLVLARSLLTAGWIALAAGIVAMTIGLVGLVLTALRDGSGAPAGTDPDLAAELADARREWRTALRDRGLLPYLRAGLPAVPAQRPDFTSPGYSPPGYTSPGPDGPADPEGRTSRPAAFAPPDFTTPGYTPPGFTGPDEVG